MSQEDNTRGVSRRTVLKGTAITGATVGLGGTASSRVSSILEELDTRPAIQPSPTATRTFVLLGIVGGWTGVGPAEIEQRTNPPLRVVDGQKYELVWINGDGNAHNFNIQNKAGNVVKSTGIVRENGKSQRVTFTARPGMVEYFCAPHPVSMRGPIEHIRPDKAHELTVDVKQEGGAPLLATVAVEGPGADGSINERFGPYAAYSDILARGEAETERGIARFDTLENGLYTVKAWTYGYQLVTQEVTIDGSDKNITLTLPRVKPGKPDKVFELTLNEGHWRGVAPTEIAGKNNPTLTVTPGQTYRVKWTNAIGRKELTGEGGTTPGDPLPGHNFVVTRRSGSAILVSNFLAKRGQTQTVDFVGEENLAIYLDESQPGAMGQINVEDRR